MQNKAIELSKNSVVLSLVRLDFPQRKKKSYVVEINNPQNDRT